MSIHDLHRECVTCGEEAYWTGEVERRADGLYAMVLCRACGQGNAVKRPDWTRFLEKHLALAQRDATYAELSAALIAATPARLLPALVTAAGRPGHVPFFLASELPLEQLAEAASREPTRLPQPLDAVLVALLLGYDGFEPPPPPAARGVQAAFVATRLASKDAARALGEWLAPGGAGADARADVLAQLSWVLDGQSGAANDAARTLLATLRDRGAAADADAAARRLEL